MFHIEWSNNANTMLSICIKLIVAGKGKKTQKDSYFRSRKCLTFYLQKLKLFVIYFWLYNWWYKKKLLHGLENQISSICFVNALEYNDISMIYWLMMTSHVLSTAIERELLSQSLITFERFNSGRQHDRSAGATHVSITDTS